MNKLNSREKAAFIIFLVLALTIIVSIWFFTSQNGIMTNVTSGKLVRFIENIASKLCNSGNGNVLRYSSLNVFIRKTAHFTEYMLLGASVCVLHSLLVKRIKASMAASLVICLILSSIDEFRQLFIAGRNAQLKDILIDIAGAAAGIIIARKIFEKNSSCCNMKQEM